MKSFMKALWVVMFIIVNITAAYASMPSGPYSSWSSGEQQEAVLTLEEMCGNQCSTYVQSAQDGGMRASYEASACIIACFADNLPADYPQMESLMQAARESYNKAQEFGSDAPVFLRR